MHLLAAGLSSAWPQPRQQPVRTRSSRRGWHPVFLRLAVGVGEGGIPVLKSIAVASGSPTGLSLSTQPLTFSTMSPHLDPNQLGILFKIPGKEKADGDRPDVMTSHLSPRSRACAPAPTPGGFISFICRCNICGPAARRAYEIFGDHVSGAGEECITRS